MSLDLGQASALADRAQTASMVTWSDKTARPRARLVHPLWTPASPRARILTDGRSPKITDLLANSHLVLTYTTGDDWLLVEAEVSIVTGPPVVDLCGDLVAAPHGYVPGDFWTADDLDHLVVVEVDAVRIELSRFGQREPTVAVWRRR